MAKSIGALRRNFDGSEPFMTGGHQIIKSAGAAQHALRLRRVPVWANDDEQIKQVLLRSFPTLETDPVQRVRASRWAVIINYYFKMGWTSSQIAEELFSNREEATGEEEKSEQEKLVDVKRRDKAVRKIIYHITLAAKGRRADNTADLGVRPNGRPKSVIKPKPMGL